MGRRKIEIQPITHERNRSVTFLKRKNGLFKKAYELGVLCSVDVAVIIFEERPGHHVKLYQYCSGDVSDIVQRHIRYDGEHDTRTPHDFANNANNIKADDTADVDDDDADDDEHDSRHTIKRGSTLKLKQEHINGKNAIPPPDPDLASVDYGMHRPVAIPGPPMHLHTSSQLQSTAPGPSLPISTERHTSTRSSLSANGSAGKLSGDESLLNGYLPSPTSVQSPAYRHNGPQLPYNSYIGSPSSTVLPSASFDFPPPSSSRGGPRSGLYSQRSATYPVSQGHDVNGQMSGMYHNQHPHPLMRQTLPSHPHATHPSMHPHPQPQNELYPALLDPADGDPHQHQHQQHHHHQRQMQSSQQQQQPQFTALDWPTHGPAISTPSHQTPPHGSAAGGPRQDPTAAGSAGENTWLDFLSQNAPAHGPPSHQMPLSLPSAEREYAAAEREVGVVDKLVNGTVGMGGVIMSPSSRKRPRTSSGMGMEGGGDRRRLSPQGLGRKKEEGH
ncbi:hypothetical protein SCLCIDRAFT_969057 [Scleroderma citrinum Foug A]|uniref:MADS-box domain-containing protein n=1 Tax=Scleroderma citrinum Foug A TaxID=1036808 RepID=A0A0C3DH89_9AGAM|nr:hypothetical protein SCLCIDRAFT_969057 [Scleroderma citrinum Foug A]